MFVNKINGVSNLGFKGYQHIKNNVGETIMKFNYPYDSDKETCEVQIFRAVPTEKYNYKIDETPLTSFFLKPEGIEVNLQDITNLDKDAPFAYKIVRKNKETGEIVYEGPDTGVKIKSLGDEYGFRIHNDKTWHQVKDKDGNVTKAYERYQDPVENYKYTLVTRKGTTPMVQGAGYLAIPDSFKPGAMYRGFSEPNTGEIYYDSNYQKEMEGAIRTFSNRFDGSIAGLQKGIPYLKQNGYKVLFTTPIANGDSVSSHSYWNKNNMQIASRMGNTENFASFFRDLYSNGMKYVYDGTFTSEGLEGIHFQHALRWAEKKPQSYYWFRMNSIKDTNLGLGVVPQNSKNLRHRIINAPYKYELQADGTYKKIANSDYDANKETLYQIYDASQAGDEQVKALDKAIDTYKNIKSGNELSINSHDDTIINYVFQINPKEYDNRIELINDLNKKEGKNIKLDTSEGTILASQFSNFKIDKKTEGGFVTWDANTDMVKMNYHISGYDEKLLKAMPDRAQRYHEQQMIERGAREVQDMAIQAGKYWTAKVNDIQKMYIAQTVSGVKTVDGINKLIEEGKLPQEAKISDKVLNNILNAQYLLKTKGNLQKDDVTVKSLMKMPLDALEFGENTVGVLSTSYFSNRATTDETIGVSRFDLMKNNNPHLVEPYSKNYKKVNSLFNNEIKDFADAIIKEVNKNSNEKLLDANGDYTEYGEYVIYLIGQDITKYAFLKSLTGDKLQTKILSNGEITYDYDKLKNDTTLKSLKINAHNPEDEAEMLANKMQKGLRNLSKEDISYVANSVSKRINGTDTASFRIAEALNERSALGLDWRLDAAKDVMDMDAIRNGDNDFNDNWNDVIKFWTKFVQGVKSENPNSYIVAEITDIPDLMKSTYGPNSCPYNGDTNVNNPKFNGEPDALAKFFNETGITSEAGYSYFFTDLLTIFAPSFDEGSGESPNHDRFRNRMDLLLQTRSVDYLRNLYTFMGNHDKPRLIHGLALDMKLFHDNGDKVQHRLDALQVLSDSKSIEEMPIELKLNAANQEYFRTLSTKAIAMSKLLKDVLNNDLKNIVSDNDRKLINSAIVDLANGNYLGEGVTNNFQVINIKELSSIKNAFNEITKIAEEKYGLKLTETEKSELLKSIQENANNNFRNYLVKGYFSGEDSQSIHNRKLANMLLNKKDKIEDISDSTVSNSEIYNNYNLYTVNLAALIRDSYVASGKSQGAKNAIFSAVKDFVEKYDENTVKNNSSELPKIEDPVNAMRKNGYAARDIRTAITMAIKQAEYKSGHEITNKDAIIDNVYKAATEPAEAKAEMIMEYLKGLFGIPTMFAGDELAMSGYEEKAKNIYLQNRNALPWEQLNEDNLIGNYRKTVMNRMNETIKTRSDKEMEALNNGTPYALDVLTNSKNRDAVQGRIYQINDELNGNKSLDSKTRESLENERRELSKELAKIAYMMQNANGDMTVTLMNAGDVEFGNRVDYFAKYGLDTEEKRKKFFEENNIDSINPENKYVPIQPKTEVDSILLAAGVSIPVGTVFMNANARDKAKYVVKDLGNGMRGIVKEGGGKIVMDGLTSKNGVMILKHIKKIVFKGKQHKEYFNPQYNFTSNPYKQKEIPVEGEKLSIIAK